MLYENTAMIRYLVVHGASLTATNALKRTASQLAADLNHVEALEALERVAETPFPPSCPLLHLCLQGLVEVRWSCPLQREGVPEVTLSEVEVTDCASGATATLGATANWSEGESEISQSGLIAENPVGAELSVRVRCKNCNGWSEWSDRGYVLRRGGADEAWEDEVYVWLYHHSLEQYYGVMKKCGVQRVEEILTMDDSRVGSGSAVRD